MTATKKTAKTPAPRRSRSKAAKRIQWTTPWLAATPAAVEARIDRIAYLMIKGRWTRAMIPRLAKNWKTSQSLVRKLADRAGVRVELGAGKFDIEVEQAKLHLEAIMNEAREAGQYTAAVRAVEAKLRLMGALSHHRPGRGKGGEDGAPRGLPPELAALDPPPTHAEVSHFAAVDRSEDCAIDGCRVHGKAAPATPAVH